jgi:hypothetical protein
MRLPSFLLISLCGVAVNGCATSQAVEQAAPPATDAQLRASSGISALTLATISADDFTPISFVLHATGSLGPGARGTEMTWTVKSDLGPLGTGTVPLELSMDQSFSVSIPVAFAKDLKELTPFENEEFIDVTLEASAGDAAASRSLHMRSPRLPTFKIPSVEATVQKGGNIALAYQLAIDSTNPYSLKLSGIDYSCFLAGKLVAQAQLPIYERLRPSSHTEYTLNQHATEETHGKALRAMDNQDSLGWKLEGVAHFAGLDVPFSAEGTVQLDK